MILVDFECASQHRTEHLIDSAETTELPCPSCGAPSHRIISFGTSFRREDAPWIETVKEVVDKESNDPATRRFLESPTRRNREEWMKSRNIRPYEEGEKPIVRKELDVNRMAEKLMQRHCERKAITIR